VFFLHRKSESLSAALMNHPFSHGYGTVPLTAFLVQCAGRHNASSDFYCRWCSNYTYQPKFQLLQQSVITAHNLLHISHCPLTIHLILQAIHNTDHLPTIHSCFDQDTICQLKVYIWRHACLDIAYQPQCCYIYYHL
jgi:hypothetical protein